MRTRMITITSGMDSRRTTSTTDSEKLRKESRMNGVVFEEVMDVECAVDGCERVFVQRLEGQEYCIRHRAN